MVSDKNIYENIYWPEDDEYRIYCDDFDNLCNERFKKIILNHKLILKFS